MILHESTENMVNNYTESKQNLPPDTVVNAKLVS